MWVITILFYCVYTMYTMYMWHHPCIFSNCTVQLIFRTNCVNTHRCMVQLETQARASPKVQSPPSPAPPCKYRFFVFVNFIVPQLTIFPKLSTIWLVLPQSIHRKYWFYDLPNFSGSHQNKLPWSWRFDPKLPTLRAATTLLLDTRGPRHSWFVCYVPLTQSTLAL